MYRMDLGVLRGTVRNETCLSRLTKHVNFIVHYPKPQALKTGCKYCWDFINRGVEVKMTDIYQNSTFHQS